VGLGLRRTERRNRCASYGRISDITGFRFPKRLYKCGRLIYQNPF